MRAFLLAAIFIFFLTAPIHAEQNLDGVAVIIGNKTYENKDIPTVDFAHRDADAFKRYVIDVLEFKYENVIDLRDATKGQIESVFGNRESARGRAFQYVKPGKSDFVLFYSGHGMPGISDKRGYLLPSDSDPATAEINGYPIDLIFKNLETLNARSVTIYLDACFSGNTPKGMLIKSASPIFIKYKASNTPKGITVITAASGDQLASWDHEAKLGLFTNHLLNGLYGAADKKGDGTVTLGELKFYLAENMSYAARRIFNREQKASVAGGDDVVLTYLPHGRQLARPRVAPLKANPGGITEGVVKPLSVSVWTEKKTYKNGQYIKIYLKGNKNFYADVIYRNSNGELIQLLPNKFRTNNKFYGGREYIIPNDIDRFKLQVNPPFGSEKIFVFASTKKFLRNNGTSIGGGLISLSDNISTVRDKVRSVGVVEVVPGLSKGEFSESMWPLRTIQ
ncbi:DUF4384 domain-containing protein [Alphaproteobacteria bacterium]|nr:DUF4384 domain-containing protein [Alphaproteobacteria bacterium]